ncbi:hypothetical protein EV382_3517 [Micromonospora violae]|uniref:Uncharacterized protein n=1 Tax=Micromonospora violae TaxID=1278207 RepID=A0A4Q7UIW3_9ACTN|nr:hypothetical protein EV382_3517 [Micromonospora violae]
MIKGWPTARYAVVRALPHASRSAMIKPVVRHYSFHMVQSGDYSLGRNAVVTHPSPGPVDVATIAIIACGVLSES